MADIKPVALTLAQLGLVVIQDNLIEQYRAVMESYCMLTVRTAGVPSASKLDQQHTLTSLITLSLS